MTTSNLKTTTTSTTHYHNTPAGAIQLLRELSSYDLQGARAGYAPGDEVCWIVTGPKMGSVAVWLAGYYARDLKLQKFNEFMPIKPSR